MKSSSFAKSVKLRLILDAPSTMTTRRRCLPDFMRFIPNFLTLFGDPSKLLLIVFPIQKFSFSLHKGAFHDTLSLISLVSTIIAALKLCILEHIFSGYLSIRHNWALWYYCFPTIWSVPQCEHQTSIATLDWGNTKPWTLQVMLTLMYQQWISGAPTINKTSGFLTPLQRAMSGTLYLSVTMKLSWKRGVPMTWELGR